MSLSGVCFSLKSAITHRFLHFLFLVLYHKSSDKDSVSCCLIPISISFYCDIRILKVKGRPISDKIYYYLFVLLFKFMVSSHPNFLLLIRQFWSVKGNKFRSLLLSSEVPWSEYTSLFFMKGFFSNFPSTVTYRGLATCILFLCWLISQRWKWSNTIWALEYQELLIN